MVLSNDVKKGIFWTFGERVGSKIIQFALQLVLARILVPEDYGLCALLLAFINIATVLVNSGLNTALVQKKDSSSLDFSSVFYVSISLSILLYIILYVTAPSIAVFFHDERIAILLRVISLSLIVGAYNSVQLAYLFKRMDFKKVFVGNILGVFISAIISIILALEGAGVWAIVAQYMTNRIVVTIVLSFIVNWHPRCEFSSERVKVLWNFGWKCMMTSFLSTIVIDIYTAVVGRCFTKSQLGAFDTGNKIPSLVSETFTSSLSTVLFSTFAVIQEDKRRLKEYVQKSNRISTFLMVPLMLGLAVAAKPIVIIILTEKWLVAVPFLQMSCIVYALYPVHGANIQAINAIGRSDVALKLEVQKKIVDLVFLAITVYWGILWVALGRVLTSLIALWINMRPNRKFLNYSFVEQVKDIMVTIVIAFVMVILMACIPMLYSSNVVIILLLQFFTGVISYLLLSYFFNKETLLLTLRTLLKR